ncbi:MAG: efflux RND transporter periplasmic adaptor subunit [Polaromonas sp.]|uniref:efflux RND transporter periplasmic adaptor subunit n=1 Tax=Polaromonas sp. TaxID=1869339 RepID=UPI002736A1CA|nr:efflux RND transporter periplasmic adaptor subunit [Polaromonas sp.]MDP3245377.1 efflux RND transporter periplasmic adaptor subunit [Polaromonas sp.]MDP3757735.1 efflux RND transporter periplasmic adaptor subunit [Polaromonas sp.]
MRLKNPSFRGRVYAGAAAALCVFTLSAQAQSRPAKFAVANAQVQALGIQTAPLQTQAESVRTSFPAQVVIPPNAEQVISSPVTGLISQLLVQPNQMVRVGAPLVRIASPELGQLQLQLLQANTRATLARQAAKREQDLFGEGLIAQRRVQEAQAALQEAEATLKQAKTALRLSGMSMAAIDKVAASGNPQDSMVLAATQAGVVTEIKAKPGQRVDSATPLMHLAQTDTLWLEIQVPVAESASWAPGSKLKVQGRDITAQIMSSSAMVASGSQMVVMRALVQGKAGQVRPGELLTVELPAAATAGAWDLPLSAVAHDGDQGYVFVRTPDGFEARAVKVSASSGQRVRVQGPVKAGEEVAISGVVALKGAWLNEKGSK